MDVVRKQIKYERTLCRSIAQHFMLTVCRFVQNKYNLCYGDMSCWHCSRNIVIYEHIFVTVLKQDTMCLSLLPIFVLYSAKNASVLDLQIKLMNTNWTVISFYFFLFWSTQYAKGFSIRTITKDRVWWRCDVARDHWNLLSSQLESTLSSPG